MNLGIVKSIEPPLNRGNDRTADNPGNNQQVHVFSKPTRREILILCTLLFTSLLIKLFLVTLTPELKTFGDQDAYLAEAQQILDGNRTAAYRGPGYPAFVAACKRLMGNTTTAVRVGNVFISGLLIVFFWCLGRELFSPRAGLLAAAWLALYPRSIIMTQFVFSENLYIVCLVAGIWLSCRVFRKSSRIGCIGAGVAFGIGILTREVLVYFLPCLLVAALIVSGMPFRERLLRAVLILITSLIVVMPWTIRNYFVHSRFMLVGYSDGIPLFEGNYPLKDKLEVRRIRERLRQKFTLESGNSRVITNDKIKERAWHWIRIRQPWWFFEKIARNGPLLLRPSKLNDVLWGKWTMLGKREPLVRKVLLLAVFLPIHVFTLLLGGIGLAHWRMKGREIVPLMYLLFAFLIHIVANAGPFRFQYTYEWVLFLAGAVTLDRGLPRSTGRIATGGLILILIVISQVAVGDIWAAAFK